jgi:hypothetical protein
MTFELASEIINLLANEEFIEIDIRQLIQTWFGKPASDAEITRKLLDFTKQFDLKYVVVLQGPGNPTLVRFWKRTELIEEPKEN